MSKEETTTRQVDAPETSRARTMLWLGVGLLVYIGIQWMLPKVGVSS
ncbi:MAG: hypothetical protein ACI9E1_002287 [Cryomorphaceae bacterium]|jgi:hypothetical protein